MQAGAAVGESSPWEPQGSFKQIRRAQEAMISMSRLVDYWSDAGKSYTEDEKLWGEILRAHAMDLGFVDIWDKMPKDKKPCALAQIDEILSGLSRRGVDLGQAHLYLERGSDADIYFNAPRAFPKLGIMPTPDPKTVGLLR